MSAEIEIGKTAAKGALHIVIGKMASRIVGVLGGIILIRLLADPAKYGLISVAGIMPQILLLFTDLGIDTAMTKYIAENRIKGDFNTVKNLFHAGLLMKAAVAVFFTFLCIFLSAAFSTVLLGKPYVSPLMSVASILILGWALSSFSRAVFMGFDATRIYAAFLVINEVLLSFLPIILVLFGLDVFGALIGMVVAMGITASLEAIVCFGIIRKVNKEHTSREQRFSINFKDSAKKILVYGLPLQVVGLLSAGIGNLYNFLIASGCPDDQIGYFSISQKGYAFVDYVVWPISLVLFPAFSKVDYKSQEEVLEKTFKYSVKYSSLVILPLVVLLMVLARPLVILLFGGEYGYAWVYLSLLSIFGLFYGLGGVHFRKLLLAQGETKFIAKLDGLTAVIGVISAIILIRQFNIFGFIAVRCLVGWPAYFLMFRKACKDYRVSVPFWAVGKLYTAITIAGATTFLSSYFVTNGILKLVVGAFMGVLVYALTVLAIGGITLTDIENLREITKDQPVIGTLIGKVLDFAEKIYLRFHAKTATQV